MRRAETKEGSTLSFQVVSRSTTDATLRMRDVCERTGLRSSTIHLYIREGLVPRPRKVAPNQSRYDEAFVHRVQLIKALQARTGLRLASIRQLLQRLPDGSLSGVDIARLIDVPRAVADSLRYAQERSMSREELLSTTPVQKPELEAFLDAKIIESRIENGVETYSPLDVRIIVAFAGMLDVAQAAWPQADRTSLISADLIRNSKKTAQLLQQLAALDAEATIKWLQSIPHEGERTDAAARILEGTFPNRDEIIIAKYRKALAEELSRRAADVFGDLFSDGSEVALHEHL